MTDLTPEELRAACEAAGLEWDDGWCAASAYQWRGESRQTIYHPQDPALPAYVASLLIAKVREMADADLEPMEYFQHETWLATPTQKIRAAMEILKS